MGLWDAVKEGAGFLANSAKEALNERNERIARYQEQFARYDDQKLIQAFKNSTGERKFAAGIELRNRGYGNQDD